MFHMYSLLILVLFKSLVTAQVLTSFFTSLTLLYSNNLNATDDVNHVGAILLDPTEQANASEACENIYESLLPRSTLEAHHNDFSQSLGYLAYAGRAEPVQLYYVSGGVVAVGQGYGNLTSPSPPLGNPRLPVLCTQSSNENQPGNAVATTQNEISVIAGEVSGGGNVYTGFRNQKSFRFLGIPYAEPTQRFAYSTPFQPEGRIFQATAYGSECTQLGGGSEDCLFLNIQTPYIPLAGSTSNPRPVMFWIHGGKYAQGSGADPLTDGGNLASREDIVVVTINYRLSTLGFFAVPGTNITGNYGIGDQITALQWVIDNIAVFGGDPNQITIIGEAGAASAVRVLLGSSPASGMFQGAIAMSNLGGGVDLGLDGDSATSYSSYLTTDELYNMVGQSIFTEAGCTQTTLAAQITCLEQVPASTLVSLSAIANSVVQDGFYVDTPQLEVGNKNGSTANVPVIFGNTADEGASLATYPTSPVCDELEGIQAALGISETYAQEIIGSGLFPYYDTGNVTFDSFNVSQRVATDNQVRCFGQASVYAGVHSGVFKPNSYYYQMQRTSSGSSAGGFDPNNLGGPPVEPGYPYGDPNLPYFRLHDSDKPWVFGNLEVLRDANDLYSIQLVTDYFAEFVKSGQPNPAADYLRVKGFTSSLEAIEQSGPWNAVASANGPMQLLDYPSQMGEFLDVPQCAFLNYSIDSLL